MTIDTLAGENEVFQATGGRTEENRCLGFLAAFRNQESGAVYLSRFADGGLAPCHLLEGLPNEAVARRDERGRVTAAISAIVAGFVLADRFYTREQAAAYVAAH